MAYHNSCRTHDLEFGSILAPPPVYMPCVFIELQGDSSIRIYVTDGQQRVQTEKANGSKTIVCQWISRWDTPEKAFSEAVGVQFAKFQPIEEDIISIIRTGKLTHAEISNKTGLSQSKISRLAKVADKNLEWLDRAVKDQIVRLGVAGNWLMLATRTHSTSWH